MLNSLDKGDVGSPPSPSQGGPNIEPHRQLAQIMGELSRLTRQYENLNSKLQSADLVPNAFSSLQNSDSPTDHQLGMAARQIYRSRRKREALMPADLFGEPAWDILLDLFASRCEGRQISITSACIASSVPSTTALRWITLLAAEGMVARKEDPCDARRAFVELTPMAHSIMRQYLLNYLDI